MEYYNNERYHESLDNVTPADVYYGRHHEIITRREQLKQRTLKARKRYNPINTIKTMMGHSSIMTTQHYVGSDKEVIKKELEKFKLPSLTAT